MIIQIETALAAFLTARFLQLTPIVRAPVRAATSNVPMPEDRSVVICSCGKPDNQGGGMHDIVVSCAVFSPVIKTVTPATHAAIEVGLTAAFEEQAQEDAILALLAQEITAALPTHTCAGCYVEGWQPGREDTAWQPTYDVKIAIDPV